MKKCDRCKTGTMYLELARADSKTIFLCDNCGFEVEIL